MAHGHGTAIEAQRQTDEGVVGDAFRNAAACSGARRGAIRRSPWGGRYFRYRPPQVAPHSPDCLQRTDSERLISIPRRRGRSLTQPTTTPTAEDDGAGGVAVASINHSLVGTRPASSIVTLGRTMTAPWPASVARRGRPGMGGDVVTNPTPMRGSSGSSPRALLWAFCRQALRCVFYVRAGRGLVKRQAKPPGLDPSPTVHGGDDDVLCGTGSLATAVGVNRAGNSICEKTLSRAWNCHSRIEIFRSNNPGVGTCNSSRGKIYAAENGLTSTDVVVFKLFRQNAT